MEDGAAEMTEEDRRGRGLLETMLWSRPYRNKGGFKPNCHRGGASPNFFVIASRVIFFFHPQTS